jgi:hypothetical protein
MNEQAISLIAHQRQVREELPLWEAELAPRPFDDDPSLRIELLARIVDGVVVIAEHGHGALIGKLHNLQHHPLRIRAIADIVAEKHNALSAIATRLGKASTERLSIGVDVGKYSDEHFFVPQLRCADHTIRL